MATHYDVAKRFVERGRPLRGTNVFADDKKIYSYGHHFVLAFADDENKQFIVNGDRYSSTTSKHQSDVRGALQSVSHGYKVITLPFTVLTAAKIVDQTSIRLIDEMGEITRTWCEECGTLSTDYNDANYYGNHNRAGDEKHRTHYQHLLAQTVISAETETREFREFSEEYPKSQNDYYGLNQTGSYETVREIGYFLSGFDETGRGFGGGYFFSKLPKKVKTIDEAYASLAPKVVVSAVAKGITVKRQGDIFAIPTEVTTRKLSKIGKVMPLHYMKPLLDWDNNVLPGAFEETDIIEGGSVWIRNGRRPQLLGTNHYATEARMVRRGDVEEVYARGILYHRPSFREADHKNIPLGKSWHKIYRNTAQGSWSVSGRVD